MSAVSFHIRGSIYCFRTWKVVLSYPGAAKSLPSTLGVLNPTQVFLINEKITPSALLPIKLVSVLMNKKSRCEVCRNFTWHPVTCYTLLSGDILVLTRIGHDNQNHYYLLHYD